MARSVIYSEPTEYIPKSVRKELGIGEYAKKESNKKNAGKKAKPKKTVKKK